MNINNAFNASPPAYSSLYPEDVRHRVNGASCANENVSFENKEINGVVKSKNGNIKLNNCKVGDNYPSFDLMGILVYSQNGNIKISNKSEIFSSVDSINGNVKIDDSDVRGGVINQNGNVSLNESYAGDIVVSSGKVNLSSSTTSSIKVRNGNVKIDNNSTVTGDVKVKNGGFTIDASKILGVLEIAGNNVTLGANSEINKLLLKCTEENHSYSSFCQIGGKNIAISGAKNIVISSGVMSIDGVQVGRSTISKKISFSKTPKNITQYITIEDGTVLRDLKFTGRNCILTLKGNANYTGLKVKNLEIIRA